ncbi:helix-turn-helix transcriptional regulator [Nodosilinea sp. LEGE 07088]|uniref:helix-turn-helix transcriptional regulator n=1 Tax=Nodosilinea sp. LEGE 07088 TaxID=2777968 RepID=UPI0028BE909C|nr:helix-turn-helix transcriptional regulator [Nodosilinea sp. LEGE 07088]
MLDTYGISQNQLAGAMGVERGSVSRWYHDKRDPTAETVVEIVEALKTLNFQAAEEFVMFYLGDMLAKKD